ncbi:hypothetical protein TCE0_017r04548 [Talaromyces pinophilus]|uniref:Uncharacterized protein n=1 Tax=Talaromyces pinophilus TaxID=128442 RepID=A0A6V8H3H4_TALPI|nr:hypothetical protein TCE0_017r04548 [Talaromyces pinophilus]
MNLEQFLIRIQSGAYEVAKQLLQHELKNEDRKQLRLVSRAIDLVVLEYPILTTLYISTLTPDLDYLEAVSKNDRLLRHVTKLVWDHSAFYLCFFLPGDSYENYKGKKSMIRAVGHSVTKLIMDTWKAQATSQMQNLENDRDIRLFTRALPFLKNVHSIVFAESFYHAVRKSPSFRTYWQFTPRQAGLPIAGYWQKVGEIYLPYPDFDQAEEAIAKLPPQGFESGFWKSLAVRGLTILHYILSNGEWNGNSSPTPCLQNLFPGLRKIALDRLPAELICPSSGGPVFDVLQESTSGIRKLNLSVPGPELLDTPGHFLTEIKSFAQMYSKSLKCIMVEVNNNDERRIPLIPAMGELLPQLALLSRLTIWMGSLYTTQEELLAFGKVVQASKSLRSLKMFELCLEDEDWEDVLDMWKQSEDLNGLDEFWLDGICYVYDADGEIISEEPYTSRTKTAIVDWLRGETTEFPLEPSPWVRV